MEAKEGSAPPYMDPKDGPGPPYNEPPPPYSVGPPTGPVLSGPPQPYPPYPPTGQGQVTAAVVVNVMPYGPYPMETTCSNCRAHVMTETIAKPGLLTCILSGGLCIFGWELCCCLIPFCCHQCQDVEHRCPNCKSYLGSYRRM